MEKELKFRSPELVEKAIEATNLQIEVKYWNKQFHILINGRHRFACYESECEAYLEAVLDVAPLLISK